MDPSEPTTIVALVAVALAVVALALAATVLVWMRRVRRAQRAILTGGPLDLVEFAVGMQAHVEHLTDEVGRFRTELAGGLGRIAHAHQHRAIIRYDGLGESAGHQSFSLALLDDEGDGVVLTALQGLDQVRVYVKEVVRGGPASLELTPEEKQAVERALG